MEEGNKKSVTEQGKDPSGGVARARSMAIAVVWFVAALAFFLYEVLGDVFNPEPTTMESQTIPTYGGGSVTTTRVGNTTCTTSVTSWGSMESHCK
jgi:hypothetical protein